MHTTRWKFVLLLHRTAVSFYVAIVVLPLVKFSSLIYKLKDNLATEVSHTAVVNSCNAAFSNKSRKFYLSSDWFKTSFIEILGGYLSMHQQQQPYCNKAHHTASVYCRMCIARQSICLNYWNNNTSWFICVCATNWHKSEYRSDHLPCRQLLHFFITKSSQTHLQKVMLCNNITRWSNFCQPYRQLLHPFIN